MTVDWTPVALTRDLPPLVVMPVTVGGAELALWRSASGRVALWADRCPHRGMRLSHGFVRGEALSCIYHGWSYGASGQCLRIPAHPDLAPPEAIRVPVSHATEQDGVIWAALSPLASKPPAVSGTPLRSLTLDAAPDLSAFGFTVHGPVASGTLSGTPVTLLLNPQPDGRVTVHALCATAAPATLAALSRDLEALRRVAEGAFA